MPPASQSATQAKAKLRRRAACAERKTADCVAATEVSQRKYQPSSQPATRVPATSSAAKTDGERPRWSIVSSLPSSGSNSRACTSGTLTLIQA